MVENGIKRRKENALVLRQTEISPGIFSLWVQTGAAKSAQAGQFVSLFTGDASMLLPRPISICQIDCAGSSLRLVYRVTGEHTGTKLLSMLRQGDSLPLIGPLGNGFPVEETRGKRVLLLAGGIGVPPMVQTAAEIARLQKEGQPANEPEMRKTTSVNGTGTEKFQTAAQNLLIAAGYRNADTFLARELGAYGRLYVASEDGSCGTKGNVLDAVRENNLSADIIFACGPKPMLKAIQAYAAETGTDCRISLEERMACGIGACLACVCRSAEKDAHSNVCNKRICKDGPVFDAAEVIL